MHSLCPKIFGHEIVKAGLILALFGGTKNNGIRSDSHVLIVGDPGLGKSQLLKACSNVAPRGTLCTSCNDRYLDVILIVQEFMCAVIPALIQDLLLL